MTDQEQKKDIKLALDPPAFSPISCKNRCQNDDDGAPPMWLISFTDVIALMLTFFVLLYAMSDPEIEKWENKIGIINNGKAEFSGEKNNAGAQEGVNISKIDFALAENLDYLQGILDQLMMRYDTGNITRIERHKDYIELSLTQVDKASMQLLGDIIPVLNSLDNRIAIIGDRTKPTPFNLVQNIALHMHDKGYKKPLSLRFLHMDNAQFTGITLNIYADDGRRIINP